MLLHKYFSILIMWGAKRDKRRKQWIQKSDGNVEREKNWSLRTERWTWTIAPVNCDTVLVKSLCCSCSRGQFLPLKLYLYRDKLLAFMHILVMSLIQFNYNYYLKKKEEKFCSRKSFMRQKRKEKSWFKALWIIEQT